MDDPKALPTRLHHGRDNTLRGSGGEIISEGWRVRRGEPAKESLSLAVLLKCKSGCLRFGIFCEVNSSF